MRRLDPRSRRGWGPWPVLLIISVAAAWVTPARAGAAPSHQGVVPRNFVGPSTPSLAHLDSLLNHAAIPPVTAHCSRQLTESGSTRTAACDLAVAAPAEGSGPDAALTFQQRAIVRTPRSYFSLSTLHGMPPATTLHVHAYGDLGAVDAAGNIVWERPAMSFSDDWGFTPDPFGPFVVLGLSPEDPFVLASERPYAVGDLNDDGVDDVAVAHVVQHSVFDSSGTYISTTVLSEVTVVDGRDGATLWHQDFPGFVTQLVLDGSTLVIGDETGDPSDPTFIEGSPGTRTALFGYALSVSGQQLAAQQAWAFSTGAPFARWLAMEPVSGGIAAGWTDKPVGASGTAGHLLLFDGVSGAIRWQHDDADYPRIIRGDSAGNVVVLDELDPANVISYAVDAYALADGTPGVSVARSSALGLTLQTAMIGGQPAWVTTDALINSACNVVSCTISGGTTAAVRAADGGAIWTTASPSPGDELFGTVLDGTTLVSAGFVNDTNAAGTKVASGINLADGSYAWRTVADLAFPIGLLADGAGPGTVLSSDDTERIRALHASDGTVVSDVPLLAEIQSVTSFDVNGDGTKDLIAGAGSGGVYALDSTRLSDKPRVLWRADIGAEVHQVTVADLGDGGDSVIAAGGNIVLILNAVTGATKHRFTTPDFVNAVTVGDLGDGAPSLVITSQTLAAYRGSDGSARWSFAPPVVNSGFPPYFSNAVITSDHRVVAEFVDPGELTLPVGVVAIDGTTGQTAWLRAAGGDVQSALWRSVVIDPRAPPGHGDGVAVTYEDVSPTSADPFPRPRVTAYGSADGIPLYTQWLTVGAVPMETSVDASNGVTESNWGSVAAVGSGGVEEGVQDSVDNTVMAHFGSLGDRLLTSWSQINAYNAAAALYALIWLQPVSSRSPSEPKCAITVLSTESCT
ncbi:MAG TPA: hypothetical protein VJU79_03605, partial [Candidatus Dormibacteraeota bacterium]|nr:hypothetical protein [Candidatus Dormibacteraeota bacterium]